MKSSFLTLAESTLIQIDALGLGDEIDVLENLAIEILSSIERKDFRVELPGVQDGIIRKVAIKASQLKQDRGASTIGEIFEQIIKSFVAKEGAA